MKKHKRSGKIGLPAGSLVHIGDSKIKTSVECFSYERELLRQQTEVSFPLKREEKLNTWIKVTGVAEPQTMLAVGEQFGLNKLILEDMMNTLHPPKVEFADNYIFVIAKALFFAENKFELQVKQISLILTKNAVISFEEEDSSLFDDVIKNLTVSVSRLRESGADFLFYSLLDTIIDRYYLLLEKCEEETAFLEESMLTSPNSLALQRVYKLKRELLNMNKTVFPLQRVIQRLVVGAGDLIYPGTYQFMQDLHDHISEIAESLRTYREISGDILNAYLTGYSNRLNEIMKFLTIISTVFIPLSFLAGLYGMNFKNMPELNWHYGYFYVLAVMVIIAFGCFLYFKRKRWL